MTADKLDAAALDAITRDATEAGGGGGGEPPVTEGALAAEPLPPDPAALNAQQVELWAMVPRTLGSVLVMAFPELQQVYTDTACANWGRAMVPVAAKYNWNVDSHGPEVALLIASTPFIIGTGTAILRRKHAARRGPGQPEDTAPAAPVAEKPLPAGGVRVGFDGDTTNERSPG